MRRHRVMMVLAGAAAVWWAAAPPAVMAAPAAGAIARTGTWHTAIEVPGLGSLNKGGDAELFSVSCGSAGNCAAVGLYTDGLINRQGYVVSERNGTWRKAITVPGIGTVNKGGFASVDSVSCTSAGTCAAGGNYRDGHGHTQAFMVGERHGAWGRPIVVPVPGNTGGLASADFVSCASAGNCAAAGRYVGGSGHFLLFVVGERDGAWGKAIAVPAPDPRAAAVVASLSCGAAGNCAAGGFYANGYAQAFVVSERNGRWGKAIAVPGPAALNKGRGAQVTSVSCATAGNCAAGGLYTDGLRHLQGFVVSERNGRWGTAITMPGLGTLNKGGFAQVNSVSCASAGNCAAGGSYTDGHGHQQAFVVSERNGRWGTAIRVPGSGALNGGGFAQVDSVSCASAGNCAAGGLYVDGRRFGQGFVVSETNGTWGKAIRVPGLGTLNKGGGA